MIESQRFKRLPVREFSLMKEVSFLIQSSSGGSKERTTVKRNDTGGVWQIDLIRILTIDWN